MNGERADDGADHGVEGAPTRRWRNRCRWLWWPPPRMPRWAIRWVPDGDRQRRDKTRTTVPLEAIPGIGPRRHPAFAQRIDDALHQEG